MMFKQPTHYFVAAGNAEGYSPLNAFDQALLEAGVGDTNLVRMSSILPPDCQRVDRIELPYGALVPVAYAQMTSSAPGEFIAAAVAIGVPSDPELPGLIMEHHSRARLTEVEAEVREMVAQGMAHRNREIGEIISIGAEHRVDRHGAAFAGVVLWNDAMPDGR